MKTVFTTVSLVLPRPANTLERSRHFESGTYLLTSDIKDKVCILKSIEAGQIISSEKDVQQAEVESSHYKVLIDSLIYFIMHIHILTAETQFTVEEQSSSMQREMCA